MLMRALIVLLLVLNAGVAAWWWWSPAPAPVTWPVHPAGVPRLQLVSEVRPGARVPGAATPVAAGSAAAPATPVPGVAASAATQCTRLGPFADAASAEAARSRLPAAVLAARVQPQGRTRGPWNVILPPQADAAAAQALAQRIAAAGFSDYYVIREGATANGIALGRFGSAEAAQRHQATLQASGFAAQVQGPAGATFWIDIDAAAAFDAQAVAQSLGAAQVLPRDCPGPRRPEAVG